MKDMKIRKETNNQLAETLLWAVLIVMTFLLIGNVSVALATPIEQAKRIHDKLIGVPPTNAVLQAMTNAATPKESAQIALDLTTNPRAANFYNVTLKNFVTPWTNVEQTVFAPLNDFTATVIGIVRDDLDFREVLTGNIVYTGAANLGLPGYRHTDNAHYEALENSRVDLSDPAKLVRKTQTELGMAGSMGGPNAGSDSAGIITTRAAGEAFFKAGTNRRMLRFLFKNFMCRDLEDVKDITRSPDRIRQDVSRSPGGDSSLFLTQCIGCHSGMDPLAGAFAYYEWIENDDGSNGRVIYTPGAVQQKHLINGTSFEFGYITRDDSWLNYWRQGPNAHLFGATGTDSPAVTEGRGARQMGAELANSPAFDQCQVEKVYRQVCLQAPIAAHSTEIQAITASFSSTHNLKNVFEDVAALCTINP